MKGEQDFSVNIGMYHADQGEDDYKDNSNCAEGAYLFKPAEYERWQYDFFNQSQNVKLTNYTVKGPVVDQYRFQLG